MSNIIDLTDRLPPTLPPWESTPREPTLLEQAEETAALLRGVAEAAQEVLQCPLDDFDRENLQHLINQAHDHLEELYGAPDLGD
jgi:hypothetical protein